MPHFFLSYARTDEDKYLKKFFTDLINEVRLLIPGGGEDVGFRDTKGILLGDEWPITLANALQHSKILVALCSPTYFTRPWCGKEWQFFSDRVDNYLKGKPANAARPRLILPILWIPKGKPPQCVAKYQNANETLGNLYQEKGLRYLRKRCKDEYIECVQVIAEAIVSAAEAHPLPEHAKTPVFNEIQNAFETTPSAIGTTPAIQPTRGPRFVQFVYVVGSKHNLSNIRSQTDAYGDTGAPDWRPFCPPTEEPVMLTAQQAALEQKLYYETLHFNEQIRDELIDRIRKAEEANKIVIILLDIWALQLAEYHAIMRAYDQAGFFNSAVIIPWNSKDTETVSSQQKLEDQLKTALCRQHGTILRIGISSREKLLEEIAVVVNERRNKIIEHTKVLQRIAPGAGSPLPVISATQDA